ncbi:NADP-dependent oxidoreductase [Devosia sp. Root436]|uniref:quinone oxidoreductase family protein n=1 Tax=Devosia sp. Root436 TaxID=1736537 RepID=UPI000AB8B74E|nr:NADP-dependent oxidoreductase [Devosia sp. Root436]
MSDTDFFRADVPGSMRAVAIDSFGGDEQLHLVAVQVPKAEANQVLLRVHTAGIGHWDAFEREGLFAEMSDVPAAFPYRLGSEGSGTVVAIGEKVTQRKLGDQVYGIVGLRTPKDGFHADYVAVDEDKVWPVPRWLTMAEAGAFASNGGTALRGLRDVLRVAAGETLLVYGASGGMGHLAIQLARSFNVRVIAVASGPDGATLAQTLGADIAIDGKAADVLAQLQAAAPERIDAALVTGGGDQANSVLKWLKPGGRIAVPNGVFPTPEAPPNTVLTSYNADYDNHLMNALNHVSDAVGLKVHVGRMLTLEEAQLGHRLLDQHILGRIAFAVSDAE